MPATCWGARDEACSSPGQVRGAALLSRGQLSSAAEKERQATAWPSLTMACAIWLGSSALQAWAPDSTDTPSALEIRSTCAAFSFPNDAMDSTGEAPTGALRLNPCPSSETDTSIELLSALSRGVDTITSSTDCSATWNRAGRLAEIASLTSPAVSASASARCSAARDLAYLCLIRSRVSL